MGNTSTIRSDRFNADIEYCQADIDSDDELVSVWGIDDNGKSYYIYFIDGIFDDNLTEEA